ncbi:hypothetical protein CEXT_749551 [Caerostris extrusa]|uniref:Uncharacterized protein n=1 Tax=Caerostris extrusa TaxID=172846 RepID=A0AAV4XN93_CAEEX|nr:hypothetical protein CEXT_749551 [Caerostris extrusa]
MPICLRTAIAFMDRPSNDETRVTPLVNGTAIDPLVNSTESASYTICWLSLLLFRGPRSRRKVRLQCYLNKRLFALEIETFCPMKMCYC